MGKEHGPAEQRDHRDGRAITVCHEPVVVGRRGRAPCADSDGRRAPV